MILDLKKAEPGKKDINKQQLKDVRCYKQVNLKIQ